MGTRFRIVQASYGSVTTRKDVTTLLRRAIANGRLIIGVGNGSLGGDAAPNEEKTLRIVFKIGRVTREGEWAEETLVELP